MGSLAFPALHAHVFFVSAFGSISVFPVLGAFCVWYRPMLGLALLTAFLTPFTRYGFPSGNDLGLGHHVLDAPLNIIPVYAPPRENSTFAEATAANGPGKDLGTLAPFAMVNDDLLWLAGTFPVTPCGAPPKHHFSFDR